MDRNHEIKVSQDASTMWRNAVATFVGASLEAFAAWMRHEYSLRAERERQEREEQVAEVLAHTREVIDAASLLGVGYLATVDEIRAAFRERVKAELLTGNFHDQRGEATDDRAQRLIAAKNLLIEHATEMAND